MVKVIRRWLKSLDQLYEKSTDKAKQYLEDLVKGSMSEIFKGDIKFSDKT